MGYPMKRCGIMKKEKNIPSLGAYIDQAFMRNDFFPFSPFMLDLDLTNYIKADRYPKCRNIGFTIILLQRRDKDIKKMNLTLKSLDDWVNSLLL